MAWSISVGMVGENAVLSEEGVVFFYDVLAATRPCMYRQRSIYTILVGVYRKHIDDAFTPNPA
jgi:hypothetical protein